GRTAGADKPNLAPCKIAPGGKVRERRRHIRQPIAADDRRAHANRTPSRIGGVAMFKIGKLFHLTQVVDDLEVVDRWYDDVFAVERFYNGYEELSGRNASLIAIGDLVLEPMTPAKVEPLKNQSVKRFHARFGQHLHSIAWYVDDLQPISSR